MITSILINVVVLLVLNFIAYKRGWSDGQKTMIRKMAENPDTMMDAFKQIKELEIAESATEVEVESHNDSVYIYNKETKLFLGQGIDLDDAMKTVCERFPDKAFWCNDDVKA